MSLLTKLRNKIKLHIEILANYWYDYKRFVKYAGFFQVNNQITQQAYITKTYHTIEKGLALKSPRVGFGKANINQLLKALFRYEKKYGLDRTAQHGLNALIAYYNFNQANGLEDDELYQKILTLKNKIKDDEERTAEGGVIEVSRKDIYESAKIDLNSFFKHRYSIRNFTTEEVDISLIKQAVKMAQKTPSVCNRQSSKVYVFSEDEDKKNVLSYQSGNRGFGDQANHILIVTSDLKHFLSIGSRYQCWIDGGMFAMSLVYALHSLRLGTCCLNWSVKKEVDLQLKKATGISDSESIIMMIAVGHIPEVLKVAQSPRKNIDEVLVI